MSIGVADMFKIGFKKEKKKKRRKKKSRKRAVYVIKRIILNTGKDVKWFQHKLNFYA